MLSSGKVKRVDNYDDNDDYTIVIINVIAKKNKAVYLNLLRFYFQVDKTLLFSLRLVYNSFYFSICLTCFSPYLF